MGIKISYRDDVSDKLVHLTKGANADKTKHREEALTTLVKILSDKELKGGVGFIKDAIPCVCFSEAPIGNLAKVIAFTGEQGIRYQPYGIIVDKYWLYKKGGMPVIYTGESDYNSLPESMKYRYVKFEPDKDIDHTQEREWRVKTTGLKITPADVTVVVPDRSAKDALVQHGCAEWHYIVLSDLGIKIAPL